MDLQELLQIQVGHFGLIIHAQQLGQCGVGEDATLEGGVKAAVALHVVGDELGHLGLRALGASRDAHECCELRRQGALDQEGIVRTTGLPSLLLLGGHVRRVDLALLLAVALLLLGDLGSLLDRLHSLAHLGGELGGKSLELLGEGRKECLRGLDCHGGRHSGRSCGGGGDDDLRLGDSRLGSLRRLGLGLLGGRCCHRGSGGCSRGGGLGCLGHLV